MASASYPLRNVQRGEESVAGTAVAATDKLVGDYVITEEIDRYNSEYPRGVLAPVYSGGVDVRKGTVLTGTTDLTFEEAPWFLIGSLTTETTSGAGPYTHAFNRTWTGVWDGKTATFEYVIDDGTTLHYEREFAYGVCQTWEIGLAANEIATLNSTWFGRSTQTSTVTAAQTAIAGREEIPSNLFTLDIDDTWAGLGGTQVATTIRAASISFDSGLMPEYNLDGRTDLDMTGLRTAKRASGSVQVTYEHNATSALEIADWRAGTLRFLRFSATSGAKVFTLDLACSYASPPVISQEDDVELVTMDLQLEYDPTGTDMIAASVVNSIVTYP